MGNPYKPRTKDGSWPGPLPSTGPSADHVKQLSKRLDALEETHDEDGERIANLQQSAMAQDMNWRALKERVDKIEALLGEKFMGAFVGPVLATNTENVVTEESLKQMLGRVPVFTPAISAEDLERVKELVETGRSYFINPKGAVYYEADDALEAALKLLNTEGTD